MLAAKLAELEASESELKALQARAAEDAGTLDAVESERTELQAALKGAQEELAQKTDALQAELEKAHAETAAKQEASGRRAGGCGRGRARGIAACLEESKNAGQRVAEGLRGELAQLRSEHDLLQAQIASGSQEAGAAIEQAQARVAELESRLDEAQQQAGDSLAASRAELEAAGSELDALRTKHAEDVAALEAANAEAAELRTALDAAQQGLEETNGRLHDELEQLRDDRASLQSQLASAEEEAGSSLEQAHRTRRRNWPSRWSRRVRSRRNRRGGAPDPGRCLMQGKLGRENSGSEEAPGQLRAEVLEISQRFEERGAQLAVNAARAERQD